MGVGVVAAGAAVAAAVAVTAPGSPEDAPARVDLNKQAVLAAAAKAELLPTGAYWYTDQIQGQSYMMRPKTGSYAIVGAHSETFRWAAAKKGGGEAFYGRFLAARPLTEQDEAAWKRAGSPAKFRVWSNDHYSTYTRKTTEWRVDDPDPAGGGRWLDGKTAHQLQDLPTDPQALAAMFFKPALSPMSPEKRAALRERGVKPRTPPPMTPRDKVLRVEDLMMEAPLSPAVRAGLMRALAAQPGVRAIGSVVDELGRRGVALAADNGTARVGGEYGAPAGEQGDFDSREEIIFDPGTGGLLGSRTVLTRPGGAYRTRAPGFVINYWLVRDSGWTDAKPKPPAKPPF
ncbi:CU044_5270 family protein [Actinomadura sp. BRA 177]|nr:CU044_5270 family protein [Actinomadura sp. BRA 177]